jgi:hypothetical protein
LPGPLSTPDGPVQSGRLVSGATLRDRC